jgi:probable HAF family extracellular repeat protein
MRRILILAALVAVGCHEPGLAPDSPTLPAAGTPALSLVPGDITVTDLGTFGGPMYVRALNNAGQVVGFGRTATIGPEHAFLWQHGELADLGVLPGGITSQALGINELGMIVGLSKASLTNERTFVWQGGIMTSAVTNRTTSSRGIGVPLVNNRGQVAGNLIRDNTAQAYLWESGTLTELGTPECFAEALNDAGHVVGYCYAADGRVRPFIWQNGTFTDLGLLTGDVEGLAAMVNERGQVAGWRFSGAVRAFFWENGVMTDLGTLGGSFMFPAGINNLGQVVGYGETAGNAYRAYLWQNGTMTDLGTLPGGSISSAAGVNDLGQVIGVSDAADGQFHGFVWQNGTMTDLGAGIFPYAINDVGQIIAGTPDERAVFLTTLRPATPAEEVAILTGRINDFANAGTLNKGHAQSLLAKLNAVSAAINRGNRTAAANVLGAFVQQVRAFGEAGVLASDAGQALIDAAQHAIEELTS